MYKYIVKKSWYLLIKYLSDRFAFHVQPLHWTLLVHLLCTLSCVDVTFLWFLFKSYKFLCLFALIVCVRFQTFAAVEYQLSRLCHVPSLLCVPA